MDYALHPRRRLNTKPGRGAVVNPAHPLARGLNGFWRFAEGTGLTVSDSAPGRNDAVLSGSLGWGSGQRGWALAAAGSSGDCRVARPDSISSLVATWAVGYTRPTPTGFPAYAGRQFTSAHGWAIHQPNSDAVRVRIDTTTVNQIVTVSGTASVGWHIAVFTIDDTPKAARLYLDSSKRVGSLTYIGTFTVGGGFGTFGGAAVGTSALTNGALDFVAIWDRVISIAEIDWLCSEPYAVFDRGQYVQTILRRAANPITGLPLPSIRGDGWADIQQGAA